MATKNLCYFCNKQGTSKKAQSVCHTCKHFLCQQCTVRHKEVGLLEDHVIEQLEEARNGPLCGFHEERMTYYCRPCNQGLCIECILSGKHSVHRESVIDFKKGIDGEKVFIRDTCNILNDHITHLSEIQQYYEDVEREIRNAAESLKMNIDKEVASLVAQLEAAMMPLSQKTTTAVQNVVQNSTMALSGIDDYAFTSQISNLKRELKSALQLSLDSLGDCHLYSFQPSTEKLMLGTLITGCNSDNSARGDAEEETSDDSVSEDEAQDANWLNPKIITMTDFNKMIDVMLEGDIRAVKTASTELTSLPSCQTVFTSEKLRKKSASETLESEDCVRCRKSGHKPGDTVCEASISMPNPNVICFAGNTDPLSNFYPCQFMAFGVTFQSVEHAFQYNKAKDCGKDRIAETILQIRNPYKVRGLVRSIGAPPGWDEKHEDLMKILVRQKVEQLPEVRKRLLETGDKMLAQAVRDCRWGTGLDKYHTLHTSDCFWPGQNVIGQIMMDIRMQLRTSKGQRSWPGPRKRQQRGQNYR